MEGTFLNIKELAKAKELANYQKVYPRQKLSGQPAEYIIVRMTPHAERAAAAAGHKGGGGRGLPLVHVSAQLEPCLTRKSTQHTVNTVNTPLTRATQPLRAPPIPY